MNYLKKALKSKTVWAGITAIVAGIGLFATGEQTTAEFLLGANGVVAIILRLMTKEPIESK